MTIPPVAWENKNILEHLYVTSRMYVECTKVGDAELQVFKIKVKVS